MLPSFRAAMGLPAAAAARSASAATLRTVVAGRPQQHQQAAPALRPGGMAEVHQQRLPAAAGGLRALAPSLPMSAEGWAGVGRGAAGARSVGNVQGNFLRGNVLEAWEKQKVLDPLTPPASATLRRLRLRGMALSLPSRP